MDRMPVCGIGDPGPIPGESTKEKASVSWLFLCSSRIEFLRSDSAEKTRYAESNGGGCEADRLTGCPSRAVSRGTSYFVRNETKYVSGRQDDSYRGHK